MNATRRVFIQTAGSAAVATLGVRASRGSIMSRPVVGFIGCGIRSQSLAKGFAADAEIAWACDPDENRGKQFQNRFNAKHFTTDLRRILDDQSVDAVVVATPDHWHAPAAIMSCAAGKHVYVEKPCSHNLRESRWLVDAARRNKVVVQHGTQSRSSAFIGNAIQLLREGAIGDVLMAKGWNVQRRRNIGKSTPSDPPAHVDYDTWVGPAEFMPFQSNRFHYDWHWWFNFGTGDIGNDGSHEIDMARWGLGVEGLPSSVSAIGGKYYFEDDQQFPDTATCTFEWPGNGQVGERRQLIFEMRIWSKNYPYNCDTGVEFYGTQGMLFVSKRGKLQMWDDANRLVKDPRPEQPVQMAKNHQVDFLRSIQNNDRPTADIAIGHDSVALIHLANTALRVQAPMLKIDPTNESIVGNKAANELLGRVYREGGHWSVPKPA